MDSIPNKNLPIFLLFHPFFPPSFSIIFYFFIRAFNVLLISISTRKTRNQRSIATIGFFRSTLASWKRKKKAVCIILKNKPRRARPCTSAFTALFFFYFEMKFDYWHAQELILENWLDRIWIVCCNSRNIVVFMVRGLMDIILFNSFLFFKCIRNFTCKDQLYVLQKLHFDIFVNRKTNWKKKLQKTFSLMKK